MSSSVSDSPTLLTHITCGYGEGLRYSRTSLLLGLECLILIVLFFLFLLWLLVVYGIRAGYRMEQLALQELRPSRGERCDAPPWPEGILTSSGQLRLLFEECEVARGDGLLLCGGLMQR